MRRSSTLEPTVVSSARLLIVAEVWRGFDKGKVCWMRGVVVGVFMRGTIKVDKRLVGDQAQVQHVKRAS